MVSDERVTEFPHSEMIPVSFLELYPSVTTLKGPAKWLPRLLSTLFSWHSPQKRPQLRCTSTTCVLWSFVHTFVRWYVSFFFLFLIIPLASTMKGGKWKEPTAAAPISVSGISIFHPSHSDLLLLQSAPQDSCKFRQDDDTPAADKDRLIWQGGSRAKELNYRETTACW